MQNLITQIIELIQHTNIWTREKSLWIEKLPELTENQLQDLLKVLQTQSVEELEKLQKMNLAQMQKDVTELEKITQKGINLIYAKGEELTRKKEEEEKDLVLEELEEV